MKQLKFYAAIAATLLFCANTNAQIVINEYSSSTSTFLDDDNEESDWIELHNTSAAEVDLKDWHLSDNAENPAKWTFPSVKIPADGYLLIMASGKNRTTVANGKYLHTNFNISSDGEIILLSNAAGEIVHQADSVAVPCNASRGLSPNGSENWAFFAEPTPGAANSTKAYASSATTSVKFSPEGGMKTSALTVTLSTEGNTPIYYTLDCTEPKACDSLLYTGPIAVDSTTVIRAVTFSSDLMPSQPSTQTYIFPNRLHWLYRQLETGEIITERHVYFIDDSVDMDALLEHLRNGGDILDFARDSVLTYNPHIVQEHPSKFELPVISLTTAPINLWDSLTGIYVFGPNATYVEPYYGANFHEDWERPVHVELYWTDGTKRLDQDAGIKIAGAWSRSNNQKSFALHARNAYGKKYFETKLFDELDITRFKSFVLRNSGNDAGSTFFRDAMITHLVAANNIDIQAYQPAIVYLNGEYWGILNMREKLNEYYIENHYPHVDHDKVDLLAGKGEGMTASEGDMTDYNAMMDFINSHDMTDDTNYQQVAAQIDVDEYIEYLVSEIYAGNDDWPHNNVKMWKSKKNGGRWRWMLYDTDQSYDINWGRAEDKANYDKLEKCLSEKGKNGDTWSNVMLRNMVKNTTFRNELSNRFADRMNREFLPKNINHLIDSLRNNIKKEMQYHTYIWSGGDDGSVMKNFAKERPTNMRNHLRKHFDVGDDVVITLNENDSKAGYIELNSLTLKKFPWEGSYFTNVPVKLRAVARPGYKFVRWENSNDNTIISTCAGIALTLGNNAKINAVFEPDGNLAFNSVVINEINYKSADDFDTKDWIELYNTTAAAINLSGWKLLSNDPEHAFTIPAGTAIEPFGYLVVCSNLNKLVKHNPNVTNFVGDFEFGLGKEDKIQLFDSENNLIDQIEYAKSWGDANGNGMTLALTDPFADNANYKLWNASDMHGTPGAQNGTFNPSLSDFGLDEKIYVDITEAQMANVSAVCYPNPVSSEASIVWMQNSDANVRIELFSAFGTCVAQICDEWFTQGRQQIDISSFIGICTPGLYVAKININGESPVNVRIIKQ